MSGDHQPLTRTTGSDTDLAYLLIKAMWRSPSSDGKEFREDYFRVLFEWHRWIRVMVGWWERKYGGMPYHDLRNNQQFYDALDCRWSVYPKPKPLSATQIVAYQFRSTIAAATTAPLLRTLPAGRMRRGAPAFDWGERLLDSTRRLVCDLYDEVNPGEKKREPLGLHRAFRADVADFCSRWGLKAWWAEPLVTHFLFLSVELKTLRPVSLNIRGPFAVTPVRIYAPLPGRADDEVQKSRAELDDFVVLWPDEPGRDFRVVHEPDREEMRVIEVERDAACVALDWDGDRTGGFGTVLEWGVAEIELRLGRRLTKRETRAVSRYVAPQVRDARKWFIGSGGFEVRSRADGKTYATWCAAMLLEQERTYVDFESDPKLVDSDVVRQRTTEFAQRAGLRWPPRQLRRNPNEWKQRGATGR